MNKIKQIVMAGIYKERKHAIQGLKKEAFYEQELRTANWEEPGAS